MKCTTAKLIPIVTICWSLSTITICQAGVAGKILQEGAERLGSKIVRESAEELAEAAARKALQEGSEAALKKASSKVLQESLERAASEAGQTAVKYSDEIATAMLKHGSAVAPVVQHWGDDAARALSQVTSQNARRLVLLQDDLLKSGQAVPLLKLVQERGDTVVEWLWKNKSTVAAATAITVLVTNPDAVLNASTDLVVGTLDAVGEHAIQPVTNGIFGLLQTILIWGGLGFGALTGLLYALPELRRQLVLYAKFAWRRWRTN
jgi:hypothetical protein